MRQILGWRSIVYFALPNCKHVFHQIDNCVALNELNSAGSYSQTFWTGCELAWKSCQAGRWLRSSRIDRNFDCWWSQTWSKSNHSCLVLKAFLGFAEGWALEKAIFFELRCFTLGVLSQTWLKIKSLSSSVNKLGVIGNSFYFLTASNSFFYAGMEVDGKCLFYLSATFS